MKQILFYFIFPIIVLIPKINLATIVVSNGTGGGDWDTPGTWVPAGIPGCVDTISILAGDIVSITTQQDYSACPSPMTIEIYGTLLFPSNGPKFKLPCGSVVVGYPGGLISAPGGDNSNKVFICADVVWESKDPDLSGPFELKVDPLPIELTFFDAKIDNTSVVLFWETSAEINNDFFTLERSENGLDFETITEIPGSGNSNTTMNYETYDDSPVLGTSYYRLKQTDFDGKFEYFKLIAVNFDQNEDGLCTLHIYPNPCIGSCTVDLKDCPLENSQVNVELYDALGKKIVNRITPKSNDQAISFHLNTSNNLAPGVYIVKSSTNGNNQSSRVIVK